MKNLLSALLLILLSTKIMAQDLDLGDGRKLTQKQLDEFAASLSRTTKDRTFFHWTSVANAGRWANQKNIDAGEMGFLNTRSGDRQAFGPGLYLAETPTSSMHYGEAGVSLTIKKGTLIYDPVLAEKVFKFRPDVNQESLIAERLTLLKPAENDWYVVNSPSLTQDVRFAPLAEPTAKVHVNQPEKWSPFRINEKLQTFINSGDQDAKYLKDILYASDYMDGISFARAMKLNPGAPWSEFEPQNFERYKKVLDYLSETTTIKNLYQNQTQTRAEALSATFYQHFEDVALTLYNKLNEKDAKSINEVLRTEGIRAGGDQANQMFEVTPEQLKVLQANPYLEVEVAYVDGKTLVAYYYPDAFHYKKLKDIISPDLYQRLQNAQNLMGDHQLRNSLNKELISELLSSFSKKLGRGEASLSDFISIHPFADTNGRTFRLLQKINDPNIVNSFIGDLDLLTTPKAQLDIAGRSSKAHAQLQADFVNELLLAKSQNRMPDYLKTKALDTYVNDAHIIPLKINLDSPQSLQQIQQRNWVPLLNDGINSALEELSSEYLHSNKKSVARYQEFLNNAAMEHYSPAQKDKLANVVLRALKEQGLHPYDKFQLSIDVNDVIRDNSELNQYKDKLELSKKQITNEIVDLFENGDPYKGMVIDPTSYGDTSPLDQYARAIDYLESDPYRKLVIYNRMFKAHPEASIAGMISMNLRSIAKNGFKDFKPEQLKFMTELYNKNLLFSLKQGHTFSYGLGYLLDDHQNFIKQNGTDLPGLISVGEVADTILDSELSLINSGTQAEKIEAFKQYRDLYDRRSKTGKIKLPTLEELRSKLLADLMAIPRTNNNISDILYDITSVHGDAFKEWKYLLENLDQFGEHKKFVLQHIYSSLDSNLTGAYGGGYFGGYGVNDTFPNTTTEAKDLRVKYSNMVPDIMGILKENKMDKESDELLKSYTTIWDNASDEMRSKMLSPDEAKLKADNPSPNGVAWKDNCINNLLKLIF